MSITSRINEIETHLKEDYTNLEALGYDIPQDKNIENIASVLDNVWENQSHIEETGTTLSMNTNKGKAKVDLLGNTYQETTSISGGDEYDSPSPDHPQPIQVVSGDNTIYIQSKNLFNKNTITTNAWLSPDGSLATGHSDYQVSDFIPIMPNTNYYKTLNASPRNKYYDKNKQPIDTTTYQDISIGGSAGTFITPNNAYYLRITINTFLVSSDTIMINLGTTRQYYEAFQGISKYPINLGDIELCKIGDYQDKFFKAINGNTIYDNLDSSIKDTLDYGEWYLEKNIGKVVLDGSENWNRAVNGNIARFEISTLDYKKGTSYYANLIPLYSNYFTLYSFSDVYGGTKTGCAYWWNSSAKILMFTFQDDRTLDAFKTWLSTHNTNVYYILATPTYTKIEGTLANQLEDVWRANTYDNQTNISQNNNDLPFELFFKALGTPSNTLLGLSRQLNQIEEQPLNEIEEESGDLDGENQENI